MPSWELFEKQSDDYKEQVLPIASKNEFQLKQQVHLVGKNILV